MLIQYLHIDSDLISFYFACIILLVLLLSNFIIADARNFNHEIRLKYAFPFIDTPNCSDYTNNNNKYSQIMNLLNRFRYSHSQHDHKSTRHLFKMKIFLNLTNEHQLSVGY